MGALHWPTLPLVTRTIVCSWLPLVHRAIVFQYPSAISPPYVYIVSEPQVWHGFFMAFCVDVRFCDDSLEERESHPIDNNRTKARIYEKGLYICKPPTVAAKDISVGSVAHSHNGYITPPTQFSSNKKLTSGRPWILIVNFFHWDLHLLLLLRFPISSEFLSSFDLLRGHSLRD